MMKQFFLMLAVIFVVLSGALLLLQYLLPAYRFVLLESCNAIMLCLSVATGIMVSGKLDKNQQAFQLGLSGASILKLFVCMIAVLIYAFVNRSSIHKPSVFVMMGIYAIYATSEKTQLMKLARIVK